MYRFGFIALVALAHTTVWSQNRLPLDQAVALVNDRIIYMGEVSRELKQPEAIFSDVDPVDGAVESDNPLHAALNRLIDAELVYQYAEDRDVKVEDTEVILRVESKIRGMAKIQGSKENLREALRKDGFDFDQLKKTLFKRERRRLLIRRAVQDRVQINQPEADSFLEEQQEAGNSVEAYHLAHIALTANNQQEFAEAKRKADAIYQELEFGAKFTEMVAKHSENPHTKELGGHMGRFLTRDLRPEILRALKQTETRGHTQPIRTGAGWEIFQLLRKETARDFLVRERQATAYRQLADELRADSTIEILKSDFNDAVDTANDNRIGAGSDRQ